MSKILKYDKKGFQIEKLTTKAKTGEFYEKGIFTDNEWLKFHHVITLSYETRFIKTNVYETTYSAILESGEIVFGINFTDKKNIKPYVIKALETNTDYKKYLKNLK